MDENQPQPSNRLQVLVQQVGQQRLVIIGGVLGIIIILVVLLLIIGRRPGGNMVNKTPDTLFAQSQAAYKQAKFADAEKSAKEGLLKKPNDQNLLHMTLSSIAAQGNETGQEKQAFADAKQYIDQALKLYPNDVQLTIDIGYLYEISGDYQKALDYYTKAITEDPTNSLAYFHRGHAYEFLDQPKQASADYDKAYSLDAGNPLVLIVKANQFAKSNDYTQAMGFFERAASSSEATNTIKAEALTGQAIIQQQQITFIGKSVVLAKEAMQADPHYAPGVATYGYNVGFSGDYQTGVDYLTKAINLMPNRAVQYWQRGVTERAGGNFFASAKDFNTALSKVERDNTILGNTARSHMKAQITYDMAKSLTMQNANKPAETIRLIEKAISYNPNFKQYFLFDYQKAGFYKDIANSTEFKSFLSSI